MVRVSPLVRPLSARSVVLSLLLGAHPPQLPVRELVRAAEVFDISEATLRVALSRMLAAGDLRRAEGGYRLSARLVDRQIRQDDAIQPPTKAWRGAWELAVVTATGRGPAERTQLRAQLAQLRLAELREGVWLRPANLRRPWPASLDESVQRLDARPDGVPEALVRALWDLDGWAAAARLLLARLETATRPAERIARAAGIVRQLLTDPVLPPELQPNGWPAQALRFAYAGYRAELVEFSGAPGSPLRAAARTR